MPRRNIEKELDNLDTLFESDPEQFNRISRELIEDVIADFPEEVQRQARGWQNRLEHELDVCKDPVSRMNTMIELFWSGVGKFQTAVTNPSELIEERKGATTVVIPLRKGDTEADGPFCPMG